MSSELISPKFRVVSEIIFDFHGRLTTTPWAVKINFTADRSFGSRPKHGKATAWQPRVVPMQTDSEGKT